MQTKRFKNLLGALLGGFLGIQALGWTEQWWALAVGVLMGASIGWYHLEIWRSATTLPQRLMPIPTQGELKPKRPLREAIKLSIRAGLLIFLPIMSLLLCLVALWMDLAWSSLREAPITWLALKTGFYLLGLVYLLVTAYVWATQTEKGIRSAYRFYDTNKFRFVMVRLSQMFLWQIHSTLFIAGVVIAIPVACVGVLLTVFVTVAYVVLMMLVDTVLFSVTKRSHTLCFLVTLTVTTLVGWADLDYIHDLSVRWMVALGTGVSSGIAMELIHLHKRNRVVRWLMKKRRKMVRGNHDWGLGDHLGSLGAMIGIRFSAVIKPLQHAI